MRLTKSKCCNFTRYIHFLACALPEKKNIYIKNGASLIPGPIKSEFRVRLICKEGGEGGGGEVRYFPGYRSGRVIHNVLLSVGAPSFPSHLLTMIFTVFKPQPTSEFLAYLNRNYDFPRRINAYCSPLQLTAVISESITPQKAPAPVMKKKRRRGRGGERLLLIY